MSAPICQWFALCDQPAAGTSRGPYGDGQFAHIPVCARCAERLDLPLQPLGDHDGAV
jgi:hypothetical protein